jgi:uncharacterized cupredoxin-like copper-binding protein
MEITIGMGPESEDEAGVEAYIQESDDLLTELAEQAPDDATREVVEALQDVIVPGLEEQGPDIFGSAEFEAAESAYDAVVNPLCDYGEMNVTAVDYGFEGIDETVAPGPVSVTLQNDGEELHEFIVVRASDEDTDLEALVDEIAALSDEEFEQQTEFQFVGAAFAEQGDSDESLMVFEEPGRYVVLCFIPEGTTGFETEGTGPPHFELGMYAEFTVE